MGMTRYQKHFLNETGSDYSYRKEFKIHEASMIFGLDETAFRKAWQLRAIEFYKEIDNGEEVDDYTKKYRLQDIKRDKTFGALFDWAKDYIINHANETGERFKYQKFLKDDKEAARLRKIIDSLKSMPGYGSEYARDGNVYEYEWKNIIGDKYFEGELNEKFEDIVTPLRHIPCDHYTYRTLNWDGIKAFCFVRHLERILKKEVLVKVA